MRRTLATLAIVLIHCSLSQAQQYAFCKDVSLPSYVAPPRGKPPPELQFVGPLMVNPQTQQPVSIKALNWFGFNTGTATAPDGLWIGGPDAMTDFSTIAYQITALGFNGIRLPFRFSDLSLPAKDYSRPCRSLSAYQFKRRLTDPLQHPSSRDLPNPRVVIPHQGTCNGYLPSNSPRTRLLYTVQALIAHGLYVLLDYHPTSGHDTERDVSATPAAFAAAWGGLWKQVACMPNFQSDLKGRILLDIMNEPDALNLPWGDRLVAGQGTNWMSLSLAVMDAVHAATPGDALFLMEGTGQTNYGLNWGNGFVTDQGIIARYGISDATPFFTALLSKPYLPYVALGPHAYPPSIGGTWTRMGVELWKQLTLSFGYLQVRGFCPRGAEPGAADKATTLVPSLGTPGSNASCHVFPVILAETGSAWETPADVQWMEDLAAWMANKGAAADGQHAEVTSWGWWSWNANSGDTGGIVGPNWHTFMWSKLRFMVRAFGLQPWYVPK